VDPITEPGTIDDMVADAAAAGHTVTPRLIRDWTQQGLLDYPQKRPAGKGHGSEQALYCANQRNLLLTLLHHREGKNISSLARIPVAIWMYWGEQYVPLRQAKRALIRFLGDPETASLASDALRATKQRAREAARAITGQLGHPDATPQARRELQQVLADAGYTGLIDYDRLDTAIRGVFEPGYHGVRRAVGHPAAPMLADSVITGIKARISAITALLAGRVSDDDLTDARDAHLFAYADYAARQPYLAAAAPRDRPDMYEPVTAEQALSDCCGHLLSTIGLQMMFPEQTRQMKQARAFHRRPTLAAFGLTAQAIQQQRR
jgi:hypothetical protein